MGLSKKLVSKVENDNKSEKYKLNHLNKIANIFNIGILIFFRRKSYLLTTLLNKKYY